MHYRQAQAWLAANGWHVWRGLSTARRWYARRPMSSPPWVVWGSTLEQVADRAAAKQNGAGQ